jgi:hypothetical protein
MILPGRIHIIACRGRFLPTIEHLAVSWDAQVGRYCVELGLVRSTSCVFFFNTVEDLPFIKQEIELQSKGYRRLTRAKEPQQHAV